MLNILNNRKVLLALGAIVIIILVLVFTAIRGSQSPNGRVPKYTPTPTPTPTPVSVTTEATYTGTNAFIKSGLTNDQVDSLKFALRQFFNSANLKPKKVDLTALNQRINRSTGIGSMSFNITLDQTTTYQGSITYPDIQTIDLTVLQDNKQIFNSGPVKFTN
jgi:hypothetical protein